MKFARIVFSIAAIWGFLVLAPLYFMFDIIGRQDPPPITHPAFFYGFVGVALAWQVVFIMIARDPVRFRPLMVPSMLEKMGYGGAALMLYFQHRMRANDLVFAGADLIFLALFVISFVLTA